MTATIPPRKLARHLAYWQARVAKLTADSHLAAVAPSLHATNVAAAQAQLAEVTAALDALVRCRRCGAPLTLPESKAARMGAACRQAVSG